MASLRFTLDTLLGSETGWIEARSLLVPDIRHRLEIPSTLVLDDYAKGGTFALSIDSVALGVWEQTSAVGKTFDISGWKVGERHKLGISHLGQRSALAGTVLGIWLPPWFKVVKGTFHHPTGIEEKGEWTTNSDYIYFQARGLPQLIMRDLELEIERIGQ